MTEKTKVAVAEASSYDQQQIDQAVQNLLSQLGGIEQYVPKNSKVLLKANLVRDMHPDQAGTTHPTVLCALANIIAEKCHATVVVGDSSGGAYTKGFMNTVYNKCQMTYVAKNSPATLNQNFEFSTVDIMGTHLRQTDIIDAFLQADVVLNVTKLKTHSFTGYTGAIKNHYGLLAGLTKVEVHSRFQNLTDFCQVLLDIEQFASKKVVLHIIDAVVGMEGEGPTNGTPKFMGKLFASKNPYLLDFVAVSLFANPQKMPLLSAAQSRGLLDLEKLDFDMENWKNHYMQDFQRIDVVGTKLFLNMPKFLHRLLLKNVTPRVSINKKICKACGKCRDHCPNKAITITKKARINQNKCIHCYCCQELCAWNAVKLKKPLVYRIIKLFSHSKNK